MHSAGRPSRRSPKSARCVPHGRVRQNRPASPPRRRQRARRRLGHRGPRTRVQHWGKTDRAKAEKALGDHIAGKYRRSFREGHPDQVLIVDALANMASATPRPSGAGPSSASRSTSLPPSGKPPRSPPLPRPPVRTMWPGGASRPMGTPRPTAGRVRLRPRRAGAGSGAKLRSDAGAATGAGRAARAPPDPGRDGALGWDAKGKRPPRPDQPTLGALQQARPLYRHGTTRS